MIAFAKMERRNGDFSAVNLGDFQNITAARAELKEFRNKAGFSGYKGTVYFPDEAEITEFHRNWKSAQKGKGSRRA